MKNSVWLFLCFLLSQGLMASEIGRVDDTHYTFNGITWDRSGIFALPEWIRMSSSQECVQGDFRKYGLSEDSNCHENFRWGFVTFENLRTGARLRLPLEEPFSRKPWADLGHSRFVDLTSYKYPLARSATGEVRYDPYQTDPALLNPDGSHTVFYGPISADGRFLVVKATTANWFGNRKEKLQIYRTEDFKLVREIGDSSDTRFVKAGTFYSEGLYLIVIQRSCAFVWNLEESKTEVKWCVETDYFKVETWPGFVTTLATISLGGSYYDAKNKILGVTLHRHWRKGGGSRQYSIPLDELLRKARTSSDHVVTINPGGGL